VYEPTSDVFGFELDKTCHQNLEGWDGIYIQRDQRPQAEKMGCTLAFKDADCYGDYEPLEMPFNGELIHVLTLSV
jgi:hypothetical protein